MRITWKVGGAAVMFVCAAELAFACTASDSIDKARRSQNTDAAKTAKDVAREVLDQEKINTDVSRRMDVNDGSDTTKATTLEAATGALLIEKFGNSGSQVTVNMQYDKTGFDKETSLDEWRDMWRKLLDEQSGPGKGAHARGVTSFTIRQHALWHAHDIISELKNGEMYPGGPASSTASSAPKKATPKPASASSYNRPAPAAAPAAVPAPAPQPALPAVDHAG